MERKEVKTGVLFKTTSKLLRSYNSISKILNIKDNGVIKFKVIWVSGDGDVKLGEIMRVPFYNSKYYEKINNNIKKIGG